MACFSRNHIVALLFYSCDVRSYLVCIDVCSDLVFGDACSNLLPTMRSEIFGSLSLLIVVEDGCDSDCLTQLSNRSLTSMQ